MSGAAQKCYTSPYTNFHANQKTVGIEDLPTVSDKVGISAFLFVFTAFTVGWSLKYVVYEPIIAKWSFALLTTRLGVKSANTNEYLRDFPRGAMFVVRACRSLHTKQSRRSISDAVSISRDQNWSANDEWILSLWLSIETVLLAVCMAWCNCICDWIFQLQRLRPGCISELHHASQTAYKMTFLRSA